MKYWFVRSPYKTRKWEDVLMAGVLDLIPVMTFAEPISYAKLKKDEVLINSNILSQKRISVVEITKEEYDVCALFLKKSFKKILKTYLTQEDCDCEELDLSDLLGRVISKSSSGNKRILEKLNSDWKHILKPLIHYDTRPIYSQELKSAMDDLEKLKGLLTQ